jgi:N-methylhydantoinase B
MFHAGGTGGRPGKDGLSATAFPSGVRNTPVEINETIAPIVVWRKEYRADSGGPGRHRGGLGQVMEIAHAGGAPFAVSTMFDRVENPARGRFGGRAGTTGRVRLASGAELRAKGRQAVPAGDRLVLEMPGGGGYGDPREREPARVAADVKNGFVSREAALRDYGVEVAGDGRVEPARERRGPSE